MNNLIKKYFYGDYGDQEGTGSSSPNPANTAFEKDGSATTGFVMPAAVSVSDWPLWEVFIRSKQGLDHKHAGSLHAADAQMAMENARDVYTRRNEGISIWVVESKHIHASNPADAASLYDPANDKIYRHPAFYSLPDELKQM